MSKNPNVILFIVDNMCAWALALVGEGRGRAIANPSEGAEP
jgi:hypothetical protein